ncbi:hypothetical protein B0H67DRAFT_600181 [Lasiosphaeris hirsuta]|uniref:Major facilitator superfamily transporter n=1 Tax=Lasiosphaeris hirsuta TaxID=260670 RepID=A0AA40ART4_9PEZI|nr:hypothetical protein B0H67DRAFT_600181 [Lasiosphaeris hirsuta]
MEQASFLTRSKSDSSFSSILSNRDEKYFLLPLPFQQPKIRVRALLGHCLYRRVVIWSLTIVFVLCLTLSTNGGHIRHGRLRGLVDFRGGGQSKQTSGKENELITFVVAGGRGDDGAQDDPDNMPHWLKYKHLDGYFTGLKALVPVRNHTPEYPREQGQDSPFPLTMSYTGLPTPTPYVPQPDYNSPKYTDRYHEVKTCYLDKGNTVPAPDLYAYTGVVQGQPEPVIGSHNLLGIRDDVCFDRFGRYGPYGLGYDFYEGGLDVGMDTEQAGSQVVWEKTGKINYNSMDWGDAQKRCYDSNEKRFDEGEDNGPPTRISGDLEKIPRTAIVVRTYVGFQWTPHVILNFRAMISELSLRSGAEYAMHFLLHVRDDDAPIWADGSIAQRVLDENVPPEFHTICTLWSKAQMRLLYPGNFGSSFSDPSNADIHGVYRSAHLPLQHFAMTHSQYAHFWNWEMDMRWLGNYYELFDRLGIWARRQSRVEMWERSERYYIPHHHGSWADFTALVHNETLTSSRRPVLGPALFPGRKPLRVEQFGQHALPASCTASADGTVPSDCGVGEDADLITLNPLFNTDESGWIFAEDVTGYDTSLPVPPRRCAIVTASRLSRRLLVAMHEETWAMRHAMFSEMFPASMALHHGMKAVYAPHPVYLDREWEIEMVDRAFNGGRDHSASGHGSPFDLENEHNHKGTSWYYHSEFAGLLWRRWLGYPQMDGRGEDGGRSREGRLRGGRAEEEGEEGSGRLCLRSVLVHPIKWESPEDI